MRIMYIAPRFHTNQLDIIKGWKEHGDVVCFVSHYQGNTEDYTHLEPIVVGYSKVFMIFYKFYTKVLFPNKADARNIKLKLGFPSYGKLKKIIKNFNPDVVILRERSVYSIFAYLYCRKQKIKSILYNQSPVWEDKIKNDFSHKIVKWLTPQDRMTPVWGEESENKVRDDRVYFIPFVMEPHFSYEEKMVSCSERDRLKQMIEILEVGKYELRKNHKLLIEVLDSFGIKEDWHLSIAGECSTDFHKKYYNELKDFIREKELENNITLYTNLNKNEMEELYKKADMFVIPSTKEPASISQLEAMSFALPVICGDKNGTACYVENGRNGFLFKDNDAKDLKRAISAMIFNRDDMRKMGKQSYQIVIEKYQFEKYFNGIMEIINSD